MAEHSVKAPSSFSVGHWLNIRRFVGSASALFSSHVRDLPRGARLPKKFKWKWLSHPDRLKGGRAEAF